MHVGALELMLALDFALRFSGHTTSIRKEKRNETSG